MGTHTKKLLLWLIGPIVLLSLAVMYFMNNSNLLQGNIVQLQMEVTRDAGIYLQQNLQGWLKFADNQWRGVPIKEYDAQEEAIVETSTFYYRMNMYDASKPSLEFFIESNEGYDYTASYLANMPEYSRNIELCKFDQAASKSVCAVLTSNQVQFDFDFVTFLDSSVITLQIGQITTMNLSNNDSNRVPATVYGEKRPGSLTGFYAHNGVLQLHSQVKNGKLVSGKESLGFGVKSVAKEESEHITQTAKIGGKTFEYKYHVVTEEYVSGKKKVLVVKYTPVEGIAVQICNPTCTDFVNAKEDFFQGMIVNNFVGSNASISLKYGDTVRSITFNANSDNVEEIIIAEAESDATTAPQSAAIVPEVTTPIKEAIAEAQQEVTNSSATEETPSTIESFTTKLNPANTSIEAAFDVKIGTDFGSAKLKIAEQVPDPNDANRNIISRGFREITFNESDIRKGIYMIEGLTAGNRYHLTLELYDSSKRQIVSQTSTIKVPTVGFSVAAFTERYGEIESFTATPKGESGYAELFYSIKGGLAAELLVYEWDGLDAKIIVRDSIDTKNGVNTRAYRQVGKYDFTKRYTAQLRLLNEDGSPVNVDTQTIRLLPQKLLSDLQDKERSISHNRAILKFEESILAGTLLSVQIQEEPTYDSCVTEKVYYAAKDIDGFYIDALCPGTLYSYELKQGGTVIKSGDFYTDQDPNSKKYGDFAEKLNSQIALAESLAISSTEANMYIVVNYDRLSYWESALRSGLSSYGWAGVTFVVRESNDTHGETVKEFPVEYREGQIEYRTKATGLKPDTTYEWTLRIGTGAGSAALVQARGRFTTHPEPKSIALSVAEVAEHSVRLEWNDPQVLDYVDNGRYYINVLDEKSVPIASLYKEVGQENFHYSVGDLLPGTEYRAQVWSEEDVLIGKETDYEKWETIRRAESDIVTFVTDIPFLHNLSLSEDGYVDRFRYIKNTGHDFSNSGNTVSDNVPNYWVISNCGTLSPYQYPGAYIKDRNGDTVSLHINGKACFSNMTTQQVGKGREMLLKFELRVPEGEYDPLVSTRLVHNPDMNPITYSEPLPEGVFQDFTMSENKKVPNGQWVTVITPILVTNSEDLIMKQVRPTSLWGGYRFYDLSYSTIAPTFAVDMVIDVGYRDVDLKGMEVIDCAERKTYVDEQGSQKETYKNAYCQIGKTLATNDVFTVDEINEQLQAHRALFKSEEALRYPPENTTYPMMDADIDGFNETAYVLANTDIHTAIRNGDLASGYAHYTNLIERAATDTAAAQELSDREERMQTLLQLVQGGRHYDEEIYLLSNPDVHRAVIDGVTSSGYAHYLSMINTTEKNMRIERMNTLRELLERGKYDEQAYLYGNPDVHATVISGELPSGYAHYANLVALNSTAELKQRTTAMDEYLIYASGMYDEEAYLLSNPDVHQAVIDGSIPSGYSHFLNMKLSAEAGNETSLKEFYDRIDGKMKIYQKLVRDGDYEEEAYLYANEDVHRAVREGQSPSGYVHYANLVASHRATELQGRVDRMNTYMKLKDTGVYNEELYLLSNPDVHQAVIDGQTPSGYAHYRTLDNKVTEKKVREARMELLEERM